MKIKLNSEIFSEAIFKLEGEGGIFVSDNGIAVEAVPSADSTLKIVYQSGKATVFYPTKPAFFRALTLLKEKYEYGDFEYTENKKVDSLGYMVDCSRNAVYTVETVKKIIRQIALMGYDYFMLYCEDTIEIKEYPMLGYMRSRYSHEEIKEIVAFGALYGIELVPCIQTLAHLKGLLKWIHHSTLKDVNDVLLVDHEPTYEFIESVVKTMREIYTTDRIHIGMDEAFLLGRGAYMNKHGAVEEHEIFTRHINRVVDICVKNGFSKQIMWSANVTKEEIPESVSMVMWDYYRTEKQQYYNALEKCKKRAQDVIFGDTAYKCTGIASTQRFSVKVAEPALAACDDAGIKSLLLTSWGDMGAEVTTFSPLPSLQLHSEFAYSNPIEPEYVSRRLEATVGVPCEPFLDIDYCNLLPGSDLVFAMSTGTALLYQDVLSGVLDKHVANAPDAKEYLEKGVELFGKYMEKYPDYAYIFKIQQIFCKVLAIKWNLGVRVTEAYRKGDKSALMRMANEDIPTVTGYINELYLALKNQWYREAKKNGFDVQDIRFGGLTNRLAAVRERLIAYCNGDEERIEELELERQFFDNRTEPGIYTDWVGNKHENVYADCVFYDRNVTCNMLSGN